MYRILTVTLIFAIVVIVSFGLRGRTIVQWISDSTKYSPGYLETAFNRVQDGMSEANVRSLLGEPLRTHTAYPGITRWYGPPGSWVSEDGGLHLPSEHNTTMTIDLTGSVLSAGKIVTFDLDDKTVIYGDKIGMPPEEAKARLGTPIQVKTRKSTVYWEYTCSYSDGSYHRRWIGFDESGQVVEKVGYYCWY